MRGTIGTYMRLIGILLVGIILGVSGTLLVMRERPLVISPIITAIARPLDRYTIPNPKKTEFPPSRMTLDSPTATTDEADDQGKSLRLALSKFEDVYDVNPYSLTNYLQNINGPLQIHQGTADAEVPEQWTDDFVKMLQDKNITVEYFTYPGSDHNLEPGWNTVVARDISFFTRQLAPK